MKKYQATDYPVMWLWLMKGCPVPGGFYCEDPERPFSARLDCVEYATRKAKRLTDSDIVRAHADRLLSLVEDARILLSAGAKGTLAELFWEIEVARGKLMEFFWRYADWEQILLARKSRKGCSKGGSRSKRDLNPAILAMAEEILIRKSDANARLLWQIITERCKSREGHDQETDKGSFNLLIDEAEFELDPLKTPIECKNKDSGKVARVNYDTFEKKYAPLVRNKLGITKKKKS